MFGSSSSPTQTASAEGAGAAMTTGSTEQPAAWGPDTTVVTAQTSSMVQRGPDAPPSSGPAGSDHLPWTTSAASGAPSPAPQAQSAPPQAAPGPIAAVGGAGRYKLQVAAVRSREEAQRLASSLSGYPAVRDGIVQTEIDEAVIGSMGTFYRVRLGPYANATEPGQLCKTLKPQGFDCLVVSQ
jgi:cell division protein FtsN